MKQVTDIHNSHKKEKEEVAKKAKQVNELDELDKASTDQEESLSNLGLKLDNICLTEEELDQKLEVFQGKMNDAKYKEDLKNAGSLFEDESKEHL